MNPYNKAGHVYGSSSGSAVAVAVSANLAMAALGTETCGSIHSPAAVNDVAALKPTFGWVPNTGLVPLVPTRDTVGAMTRTAKNNAIVTGVLLGSPVATKETKVPTTTPLTSRALGLGSSGQHGLASIQATLPSALLWHWKCYKALRSAWLTTYTSPRST